MLAIWGAYLTSKWALAASLPQSLPVPHGWQILPPTLNSPVQDLGCYSSSFSDFHRTQPFWVRQSLCLMATHLGIWLSSLCHPPCLVTWMAQFSLLAIITLDCSGCLCLCSTSCPSCLESSSVGAAMSSFQVFAHSFLRDSHCLRVSSHPRMTLNS